MYADVIAEEPRSDSQYNAPEVPNCGEIVFYAITMRRVNVVLNVLARNVCSRLHEGATGPDSTRSQ